MKQPALRLRPAGRECADPERAKLIAFFGALCLFFSTLEYLIPKPVPFFRLGLANLPILLAFPLFSGPDIIILTVLKVLGQALVNGTLTSYVFLFSLSGSVASVFAMYVLWRIARSRVSWIGLSLIGALASNAVQIVLSLWFIFGPSAWVIAPVFMGLGLLAGLGVGICAIMFEERSTWYQSLLASGPHYYLPQRLNPEAVVKTAVKRRRGFRAPAHWDIPGRFVPATFLFWAGLLILPAFLFQENIWVRGIQVAVFMFLAFLAGKRISWIYFVTIVASITFFNLLVPTGLVLTTIWGFPITELALSGGIFKGLGIMGLVMVSLATVRKDLHLPGKLGGLLARLFRYYEEILVQRPHITREGLFDTIDHTLYAASTAESIGNQTVVKNRSSILGILFSVIFVIINWLALFVKF